MLYTYCVYCSLELIKIKMFNLSTVVIAYLFSHYSIQNLDQVQRFVHETYINYRKHHATNEVSKRSRVITKQVEQRRLFYWYPFQPNEVDFFF